MRKHDIKTGMKVGPLTTIRLIRKPGGAYHACQAKKNWSSLMSGLTQYIDPEVCSQCGDDECDCETAANKELNGELK